MKNKNGALISSRAKTKNWAKMNLLISLPPFQGEVQNVRKAFGIPIGGFTNSKDLRDWCLRLEDNELQLNNFRSRIEKLGGLFHLPVNFSNKEIYGLWPYVVKNHLFVPASSFAIYYGPAGRKKNTRYSSAQFFTPPSKKEWQEVMWRTKQILDKYFPDEALVPIRSRRQLDRDISIFNKLLERTGFPVRSKIYRGYLSYVQKSVSREKLRNLELLHKNDVLVAYNQPICKDIAKELKISVAAVRQSFFRTKTIIKKLFGIDLKKTNVKGAS